MDVYLLPVSADRHELYCEVAAPAPATERSSTLWGRLTDTFRRALAEGEEAQHSGDAGDQPKRSAIRRAITKRLAEAVAEQRLLWHLRQQDHARLIHPDDTAGPSALETCRRFLAADRDKHRRWLIIDALLTALSGLVFLVPGPNVLAYYFIFRTVGHYLSMKGAERGLSFVTWTLDASPPLTALRAALVLPADDRTRRVDAIAEALGLERLPRFVDRIANRSR